MNWSNFNAGRFISADAVKAVIPLTSNINSLHLWEWETDGEHIIRILHPYHGDFPLLLKMKNKSVLSLNKKFTRYCDQFRNREVIICYHRVILTGDTKLQGIFLIRSVGYRKWNSVGIFSGYYGATCWIALPCKLFASVTKLSEFIT